METMKTKKPRKEDQRTRLTKLMIRQAFLRLLEERPINEITVSELCEAAGISRVTFYLHYKNIFDLNDKIKENFYKEIQNSLIPLLTDDKKNLPDEKMVDTVLRVLYENRDIISAMVGKARDMEFVKTIIGYGHDVVLGLYPKLFTNKAEKDFNIFYTYVSGGIMSIIRLWVNNNFQDSIEELSRNIRKLIAVTIKYFD